MSFWININNVAAWTKPANISDEIVLRREEEVWHARLTNIVFSLAFWAYSQICSWTWVMMRVQIQFPCLRRYELSVLHLVGLIQALRKVVNMAKDAGGWASTACKFLIQYTHHAENVLWIAFTQEQVCFWMSWQHTFQLLGGTCGPSGFEIIWWILGHLPRNARRFFHHQRSRITPYVS